MGAPQRDQLAHEADQFMILLAPVMPGNFVVLVVGIVVPELGAVHLIAAQQHRDPVGQQQGGQEITLLPGTQGQDGRVVGGPLGAAVPGAVVPVSVPVTLAVGLVVLVVIGHQVPQGKAVMAGDEVDRGERAPAVLLVQITGPGQPDSEIAQRGVLAVPEIPDPVPVLAVPFGPQRREVPDLVAALAHVPRFGDELDLGHDRILLDQVEERRQPVHRVQLAGQHGRQVEPEPVHAHLGDPVPQRVHHQRQDLRMTCIEAIPAPAEVHVEPRVVLFQPVVRGIVDPPEAQRRPQMVALGGVVVHHVEDHLDPGRVQRFHHRLEFVYLPVPLSGGRIAVVRGEVADGAIAPVISETLTDREIVRHELVHRHQLDSGHTEALQVADDGRVSQPRIRALQLRRNLWMTPRQATDMDLVDDRVGVGDLRAPIVPPVEDRIDYHRSHHVRRAVQRAGPQRGETELVSEHGLVPADRAVHRLGVRIQEQLVRIAHLSLDRIPRPMDPIAIVLPRANTEHVAVPDEAINLGERDPRFVPGRIKQAEVHSHGDLREQGEVSAPFLPRSAQRKRRPWPDAHPPSRPEPDSPQPDMPHLTEPDATTAPETDPVHTSFRVLANSFPSEPDGVTPSNGAIRCHRAQFRRSV